MKPCGLLCSMCGSLWTSTSSVSCCVAAKPWGTSYTADAQVGFGWELIKYQQ
jgi:hypothetical protein